MSDEPRQQNAPSDSSALESLNRVGLGALAERMGIHLTEASPTRVVATMPVEGNTQPFGLLNGGAHAVLAETLGSIGSALVGAPDTYPVGIELSCSHHRSITEGIVTATASVLTSGRTLCTWEIVMTDEQGRRLSTARLTCLLRERPT